MRILPSWCCWPYEAAPLEVVESDPEAHVDLEGAILSATGELLATSLAFHPHVFAAGIDYFGPSSLHHTHGTRASRGAPCALNDAALRRSVLTATHSNPTNSSTDNPACRMSARTVPFFNSLWSGMVRRR
jgi:hypothetical protein